MATNATQQGCFVSRVLETCGYLIKQPTTNNELVTDAVKFRKNLADWLVSNNDELSRIETEASKFLKSVKTYLTDNQHFLESTRPTRHNIELIQPSLLHCLLGIEGLQSEILKIVYGFLGVASASNAEEDTSFGVTILHQLKWLPQIVDEEGLFNSLMGLLAGARATFQSAMIKVLPDVLPTNLHSRVAFTLKELFTDDEPFLNIALMECFAAFNVSDAAWTSMKTSAINQMATAPIRDLPAYFSFLFQGDNVHELAQVITTIREKVELPAAPKSDSHQVEIIERIGFCVTVNPRIARIWAKEVKLNLQGNSLEAIKKLDLLALFIFAEADEPSATVTMKKLFLQKDLSIKLFDQLICENLPSVYRLFNPISKLLDKLMRTHDVWRLEALPELTGKLFMSLSAIEAQTLMGNMSSVLVNCPPARCSVLEILTYLAEAAATKLLHFAPYIMGMLDYMTEFQTAEIRSLMGVLAVLSQTKGRYSDESNSFVDEFSILLRKQLTNYNLQVRRYGVYGALASVRQMTRKDDSVIGKITEDRVQELLTVAWKAVELDEDSCRIFLDEISTCVPDLPVDICQSLKKMLWEKFSTLWLMESSDVGTILQYCQRKQLNLVPAYGISTNSPQERQLISFEDQPMRLSPLVIPAHVSLLNLLEERVAGSRQGITEIMGHPILIPDRKMCTQALNYDQRFNLGNYLILGINFFRECVSALSRISGSGSDRKKIWIRLANVIELQKLLVKDFDLFPNFPRAYIGEETNDTSGSKSGRAGPSTRTTSTFRSSDNKQDKSLVKKGPTKRKVNTESGSKEKFYKKKPRTEADPQITSKDNQATGSNHSSRKPKTRLDEEIQPSKLHPFLRRLDESVFWLIQYPLKMDDNPTNLTQGVEDISFASQNAQTNSFDDRLTLDGLALILSEIKRQAKDKHSGWDILKTKDMLLHLATHMHQIHMHQLSVGSNALPKTTDCSRNLECCLCLIFDILITYFNAIQQLEEVEKEIHIQGILHTVYKLASQDDTLDKDDIGMLSPADVILNVTNYLSEFLTTIQSPPTAQTHVKLLRSLHDALLECSDLKTTIEMTSVAYLQREWTLPSSSVDEFLKHWIGTTRKPMVAIKQLVEDLLGKENKADGANAPTTDAINLSAVYKSCSGTNFHTWYGAMFSGLSRHVYQNLRNATDSDESVDEWIEAVNIFRRLVSIAQMDFSTENQKTLVLAALLRNCRLFLEAFISGGAHLLPEFIRTDGEKAKRFCKMLQLPCRIIQNICEHSKIRFDLRLLKFVPIVKRSLETLIFRVREVLSTAGAASAFQIGSLRHKNLQGEIIKSQITEECYDSSSDDGECREQEAEMQPRSSLDNEATWSSSEEDPDISKSGDEEMEKENST